MKDMKRIIFIAKLLMVSLYLLPSCNNDYYDDGGIPLEARDWLTLQIVDEEGRNLLDSSTPNHYLKYQVSLYSEQDGKLVKRRLPEIEFAQENVVRIPLRLSSNKQTLIDYIEWAYGDMDTIVYSSGISATDIYYNGKYILNHTNRLEDPVVIHKSILYR